VRLILGVVAYVETNVRVPPCASAALQTIAARRGTSRDETVRRLLSEYVERQEHLDPEERLTHVSTVLRYQLPPFWPKAPSRIGRCGCGCLPVLARGPGLHSRAVRELPELAEEAVRLAMLADRQRVGGPFHP
jgi:hypothetical protein